MNFLNFKRRKKQVNGNDNSEQKAVQPFKISSPLFPPGSKYVFNTDNGMKYEIKFQRSQNDLLCAIIIFRLINEGASSHGAASAVEEKEANMLRIMATVSDIIKLYMNNHPWTNSYRFYGDHCLNGTAK